jgi:hypothetical protein
MTTTMTELLDVNRDFRNQEIIGATITFFADFIVNFPTWRASIEKQIQEQKPQEMIPWNGVSPMKTQE